MNPLTEMLLITVLGLCIVFSVLIILWGVIALLHKVAVRIDGKPEEKQESATQIATIPEFTPEPVSEPSAQEDEGELIAVLTAAVAASLNTSTYHLRIKSFRRVGQTAPVWNAVSRKEQLDCSL